MARAWGPPVTSLAAEWYETIKAGRNRVTSLASAWVSGSDSGNGPPPPGTSVGPDTYVSTRQSAVGQLRFGSTPLASMRVLLARPSGFAAVKKVRPSAGGTNPGSI